MPGRSKASVNSPTISHPESSPVRSGTVPSESTVMYSAAIGSITAQTFSSEV